MGYLQKYCLLYWIYPKNLSTLRGTLYFNVRTFFFGIYPVEDILKDDHVRCIIAQGCEHIKEFVS